MAPLSSIYTRVRDSESDLDLEKDSARKLLLNGTKGRWYYKLSKRSWFTDAVIIIAALLTTIGIGVWAFRINSSNFSDVVQPGATINDFKYHCGSTIAEAKSLGCKFDLLSAAWVPPPCIDTELTEQFRREKDWKYYLDREGTMELPESELEFREGGVEGEFWATLEWHQVHCGYEWRKMHRALEVGGRVESALGEYHHTVHCGKVFKDRSPLDKLETKITVEFLTC